MAGSSLVVARLWFALQMSKFDQRFLFVTGKGGVGKTTVSVALARHLAKNGRRVLLAVTEGAGASRLLGVKPGHDPTPVPLDEGALWLVEIEPEASIRQYAELILHSHLAVSAIFDNRYSRSFLRAVPGLYQWATLGKAWFHTTEEVDGRPRFDTVVFDAPATGHGLEMLRVPRVISEASPPGPLRRDADAAWQLFSDADRSGVVLVTLPEELPVTECIELAEGISQLGLPVAGAVVNARLPDVFLEPPEVEASPSLGPAAQRVLAVARDRYEQESSQRLQQKRLKRALSCPLLVLPWLANLPSAQGSAELALAFESAEP